MGNKDKMDIKDIVSISVYMKNNPKYSLKWMTELKCFNPTGMKLDHYKKGRSVKYKEDVYNKELKQKILDDEYRIQIDDLNNSVECFVSDYSENVVIATANLEYDIYYLNEKSILSIISDIMVNVGIVATIEDLTDWFLQNTNDVSDYKVYQKSLAGIPLVEDPYVRGKKIIDVEKLPGYGQQIGSIWVGAAWKIWFGRPYYEFVPRECIERFQECYSNEKISDDCYCITLYKDLNEYSKPENRKRQWKFKEAINFPAVVKKLKEREKNREKNPSIEIKSGNFEHGGMKQFWYYVDSDNNLVKKSNAVKIKIHEYDRAGYIIWRGEQEI